ncbi:MAG: insulinase family protein [Clostridia bacterium]|nr:insulinase family protein [Clostridia bacterium]
MIKKQYFEGPFGEGYVKAVHPTGLEIYIMEKPNFDSAHAVFGTKYGSIDTVFSKDGGEEISVPEGIAHFLEHKLFESEEGDAFTRFAATGASANAYTSFDRTCYLFTCGDNFYENLKILLDFVQHPYFTQETVEKEQGIIGQEIGMYDDNAGWRVMFNMLKNMYSEHPVRIDIAGTVESIAQIDASLLYRCYETFYNPSNMFICIAGNVDADKILKQIEEEVIYYPPVEISRKEFIENESVANTYVEQELSVAIPAFCYGYKQKITTPERSLKTKVCMSLLLELICGEASPLYARLVREGLINDEFGSEYFCGRGYATMLFEGESTDPKRVAEEIDAEINRIRENGIDKKLFSAVKCGMYGDAVRRMGSVVGSAMSLVESAVSGQELYEEIKLLKSVTAESVVKRLVSFSRENSVLSVIVPKEEK